MEVYLLEASPYDPGTATTVAVRLSSNGRAIDYGGNPYEPRLSVSLDYTSEIFSGNLPGASTAANGNVLIANPDGELDYLLDYSWDGRDIVIKYAPDEETAYGSFTTVFSGSTKSITVGEIDIILILRDNSERLAQVIQPNIYLGTGGSQGQIDNKNKPKPLLYGKCFNFEPILIDGTKLIYQLNDGVITTLHDVFDRGVQLTAGSNFATHALLDAEPAINITPGTYATCLAQGYIRLGALPAGLLTCDASGFPVYTIADIVQNILLDGVRGGLVSGDLDTASFTAFEAASNWECGYFLKESEAKVSEIIEELVSSVYGYWYYDFAGLLVIKRFAFATVVDTIEPFHINTIKREESQQPNWSVDIDYKRVWRVHGRDEIAFADSSAEVPVAVFKRYYQKPTTPTGDGIPSGWLADFPGYSTADTVGPLELYGPVWVSTATQLGGITQGSWSEPRIDDADYRGWYLGVDYDDASFSAKTNALKVNGAGGVQNPVFYINKKMSGAFRLSWKVATNTGNWCIGVMTEDPTVTPVNDNDFINSFLFTFNDNVWHGGANITKLSQRQDYSDIIQSLQSSITAGDQFEITYNGQVIEYYHNDVLLASNILDQSQLPFAGSYFHAGFYIKEGDAEIYDIVWEKGTTAKSLSADFSRSLGNGLIDFASNQIKLSSYDGVTVGNFELFTYEFQGVFTQLLLRSVGGVLGVLELQAYGAFYVLQTGTLEARDQGGVLLWTGTWVNGDVIAIDADRQREIFYKNGAIVFQRNTTSIGYAPYMGLSMDAENCTAENHIVQSRNTTSALLKGSETSTTFVTPFTNATPTIAGGYVLLATTADLLFAPDVTNLDRITVKAGFTYDNNVTSAVSFQPDIGIDYSYNSGSSWTAATLTFTPGPPTTVAAGVSAGVSMVQANINPGGTTPVRIRVKIKNQIAGVYSVALTAVYLTVEWRGS